MLLGCALGKFSRKKVTDNMVSENVVLSADDIVLSADNAMLTVDSTLLSADNTILAVVVN
jgi:hypothetical protein